ncbi:hypothetical protein ACFU76_02040 [Streptomyces sp. NPDC057539]|uniref:hypothetical protein n=1 Tax=Streptomyces sp. NPDC057539 TaxID=3346159 RepID=UPI00369FDE2E
MICPFCNRNLLLRERPNRTCSHCKRRYALDPKTNSLRLSDARVHRLLAKLTDGGRLKISAHQLGAAALPKSVPTKSRSPVVEALGCLWVPLLIGVIMVVAGVSADDVGAFTIFGSILIGIFVLGMTIAAIAGGKKQGTPHPLSGFRSILLSDWVGVYGALPAGIVDDFPSRRVYIPEGARLAVLCGDRGIAAFLVANGIPERYGAVVATEAEQVPDALPVLVLHDASAPGCRSVVRTREALPGRTVIDAGLPPRAVMNTPGAPVWHGDRPAEDLIEWLGESGTLTKGELEWLARGCTVPLTAVRPAKLLAAVGRTVERLAATTPADPERREAEAVGFLTWPGEAGR